MIIYFNSMQDKQNESFFAQAFDPVRQAGVVLGCSVVFMVFVKIASWTGMAEFEQYMPWVVAASFLLFFAVFNSVFSLTTDDMNKYWIRSIISYFTLAIISGMLAYLASSVSFNEAGTIRWIFIVLTFVYLIFLSIVNFMKRIVSFAEKEEWNAPKKRKKRK